MKKLRAALLALILGATAFVVPTALAPSAAAHGWITSPPSRQDHCAKGTTSFDCGSIKYEPQSVEAPKGSMQCSGGSQFPILDENRPWPRTTIGSTTTFQWQLTAAHNTSTWEYYVDGQLHQTFNQGGAQPPSNISHTLTNLPPGNHTILARWNVSNTPMAFYNCVDVFVTGGGGDPTGSDPTGGDPTGTDPTGGDPTGSGECTAPGWASGMVYTGGNQVTYDGRTYEAKWWTLGENPSASGEWGPWRDLGPC